MVSIKWKPNSMRMKKQQNGYRIAMMKIKTDRHGVRDLYIERGSLESTNLPMVSNDKLSTVNTAK